MNTNRPQLQSIFTRWQHLTLLIEEMDKDWQRSRPFSPRELNIKYPQGRVLFQDVSELNTDSALILNHCAHLCFIGNAQNEKDHFQRKGFTLACRLTGLSSSKIIKALSAVRLKGSKIAGEEYDHLLDVADDRLVGVLYAAASTHNPNMIKIGFTTNLQKRMKALSGLAKNEVVCLNSFDATMLHEWAIHSILFGKETAPEWYDISYLPSWLISEEKKAA